MRWLVTRAEMTAAALAVVLAVVAPAISPAYQPMMGGELPAVPILWLVGVAGTLAGAIQVLRLSRSGPECGPPAWRYRGL